MAKTNQKKVVKFNQTPIGFNFNENITNQNLLLFSKRKYGLYKNIDNYDKKIKNKLIYLSNFFKMNKNFFKKNSFIPKTKIIFYKKLNKFFYRSGRSILMNNVRLKKYIIQKYINKKIYNFVKKPFIYKINYFTVSDILIKCNIFYSFSDCFSFVKNFGILVDNEWIYNPNKQTCNKITFSIINNRYLSIFLKIHKIRVIKSLSKIKFYKYRSKLYKSQKNFAWVKNDKWLQEYSFLLKNKNSAFEFDWKVMSGVYLYNSNIYLNSLLHQNSNLSIYMHRSYMWKYLT